MGCRALSGITRESTAVCPAPQVCPGHGAGHMAVFRIMCVLAPRLNLGSCQQGAPALWASPPGGPPSAELRMERQAWTTVSCQPRRLSKQLLASPQESRLWDPRGQGRGRGLQACGQVHPCTRVSVHVCDMWPSGEPRVCNQPGSCSQPEG